MFFIGNDIVWGLKCAFQIIQCLFPCFRMPAFHMLNLIICNNHLIRYDIIRYTFVNFFVNFSNSMHILYLFCNSWINYTSTRVFCNRFLLLFLLSALHIFRIPF